MTYEKAALNIYVLFVDICTHFYWIYNQSGDSMIFHHHLQLYTQQKLAHRSKKCKRVFREAFFIIVQN